MYMVFSFIEDWINEKSEKTLLYGHDTNRIADVTIRFFPFSCVFVTFILTNAATYF